MRRLVVIVLLFVLPIQVLAGPLVDQVRLHGSERHPLALATTAPSSLDQAWTSFGLQQDDVAHILQTHVDISDAAVIINLPAPAATPPAAEQPVYTPRLLTLLFFPVLKPPLI